LRLAEELVGKGERDVETIRGRMLAHLKAAGVDEVQYIAFVAEGTIAPVRTIAGPTAVAIAAKVGATRLIDNVRIG
jgi:pantoate--beta-alanine ligase